MMLNNRVLATPLNMRVPTGYIQSQFKIGQWTVVLSISTNPPTQRSFSGWGWMNYRNVGGLISLDNKGSLTPTGAIDGIYGGEALMKLGIHPVDKTIIFEGREYKNNQDCSNTPLAAAWKDGAVLTIFVPQGGGVIYLSFLCFRKEAQNAKQGPDFNLAKHGIQVGRHLYHRSGYFVPLGDASNSSPFPRIRYWLCVLRRRRSKHVNSRVDSYKCKDNNKSKNLYCSVFKRLRLQRISVTYNGFASGRTISIQNCFTSIKEKVKPINATSFAEVV